MTPSGRGPSPHTDGVGVKGGRTITPGGSEEPSSWSWVGGMYPLSVLRKITSFCCVAETSTLPSRGETAEAVTVDSISGGKTITPGRRSSCLCLMSSLPVTRDAGATVSSSTLERLSTDAPRRGKMRSTTCAEGSRTEEATVMAEIGAAEEAVAGVICNGVGPWYYLPR